MIVARSAENLLPFDTCAKGTTVIQVAVMMKGVI
jgi:hypothetical protein